LAVPGIEGAWKSVIVTSQKLGEFGENSYLYIDELSSSKIDGTSIG